MQSEIKNDYIVITNSPGELSAWVYPVVTEIKARDPQSIITVLLVPCFYSTGREKQIAENFDAVDRVLEPKDFIAIALGMKVKEFTPSEKGIVISLGGDPWHAVLIAKRLRYPAVIYTMKKADTSKSFAHIFAIHQKLKDKFLSLGVHEDNISVVGDLMHDSVRPVMSLKETRNAGKFRADSQVVSFFPGSRLSHVEESLPVFMKSCEEIKSSVENTEFVICLSPFVTYEDLKKFIKKRNFYQIEGVGGTLENDEITTENGVKIKIEKKNRYDIICISDLVITIPGTNTAEIASLGKPMIVAFTWKAKIPSGGLGFFVNAVPLKGVLKKAVMTYMYRNVKYKGLPNALADREITPEVVVDETSGQISSVAIELLNDPSRREQISKELLHIMGGGGASVKIAQKCIEIVKEHIIK